jgi:pimeloyl-ACP methyl ester carboxylesterase
MGSDDVTRRTTFAGGDGLRIAADVGGPPEAPVVVFGHGGGQTRHSWAGGTTRLIEAGYRVINYDLRGHGESEWSPEHRYEARYRAEDLLAIMGTARGPIALVGASMGGLTAFYAAMVARNADLRALVLVDIVPKPSSQGVQHITEFMRRHLDGFDTIEQVADAVQSYNPHRPRPSDLAGLRRNLRERDGRLFWHWDPCILRLDAPGEYDALRRTIGARGQPLACPTLLIRGLRSDVVSSEGISELVEWLPQTEIFDVEGAGHMVAGDRNDSFNVGVIDFLARHMPAGAA